MTNTVIAELISSVNHQHLVQRYGLSEGLFKGVALASNLSLTALISLFPGLGPDPILASTSIHFFFSAFLEIPTSFLAHKYGANRSVLLGLSLKFVATILFLFAFWAAQDESLTTVMVFILLEAFIDGLANAFISGAWQSAYSSLYQKNVKTDEKNLSQFFYESAGRGLRFRLGIPVGLVLACVAFPTTISFVVYLVLILRIMVVVRIGRDLGWGHKDIYNGKKFTPLLLPNINKKLFHLFVETFIYLSATSYFPARFYENVKLIPALGEKMIWHVAFSFLLVLCSYYYSRLANTLKKSNLFFGFGFLGFGLLNLFDSLLTALVGITFIATSMFLKQRITMAQIIEEMKEESHVGWLSLAQASAMILFSFISFVVMENRADGVRVYSTISVMLLFLSFIVKVRNLTTNS